MGRSLDGTDAVADESDFYVDDDELPERDVTVADFRLDKFEVTLGRFEPFISAYDGTPPTEGAGADPRVPGSGWDSAWNAMLPRSREELVDTLTTCSGTSSRESVGEPGYEILPVNCARWAVAFAFCAWDGGRLPTDAEWEYAAAGGAENRLYPWGSAPLERGVHGDFASGVEAVGSYPMGQGRWGHQNLAGNVAEWTLEIDLSQGAGIVRGSGEGEQSRVAKFRAAARDPAGLEQSAADYGVRCARAP